MKLPRRSSRVLFALYAAAGCAGASALGLGSPAPVLPIGMPLDVQVPVRLDAGESLVASCVRVEVRNGDLRLPPGVVRHQVLSGPGGATTVRINSATVIDEPIVSLQLTVGCDFTVSREYVLLAEPLMASAPAPAVPLVAAGASAPPAPAVPAPVPDQAAAATQATPSPVMPAQATAPAARPRPATTVRPAPARPAARAPAPARAPAEARPRLRLEPTEPVREAPTAAALRDAFDAVARAASAAEAAASAASSAQARVVELESNLARMTEAARERDLELARLRKALAESSGRSFDATLALGGLVLLLAPLALWLGWQLRSLRRQQEKAWADAAAVSAERAVGAEPAAEPLPPESGRLAAEPSEPVRTTPGILGIEPAAATPSVSPLVEPAREASGLDLLLGADAAHAAEGPMERTEVLPQLEPDEVWPLRDVSIEELIDVDQQAEFFVALGQDNAAIDLLVAHLRDTGGGSPLTYLKLLEIYARQGDEAAYERLRERFNQRYHANAPEWGKNQTAGRGLDDYPDLMPRLVAAWGHPLAAMAELEELLMRTSRSEPLDLPAYRDVLFLYSLARDRVEHEPASARVPATAAPALASEQDDVDLLLPLDEPSPLTFELDLPADTTPRRDAVATSAVDLDLSLPSLDLDLPPEAQAGTSASASVRPPGSSNS